MRKVLAIVMALLIAASVAACIVLTKKDAPAPQLVTPGEITTSQVAVTTKVVTTDSAKIKELDAISLIESYSDKELGINKEIRDRCSFMIASNGEKIDGKYYVKVIAAIKESHKSDDDKITFTFDTKGEYYISYDGNTILSKNLENGEYTQLKNK